MPIFEYRCGECGARFEVLALPGLKTPYSCPECGSSSLGKLFSTFSTPASTGTGGGLTCCGREDRCDSPPCDSGGACSRD